MATTDSLRKGIRQYETTTGRRISPEALQALLAAELDVQASRESEVKAQELQQQGLDLRREQAEAERQAAKASGIAQIGGTAVQAGILLKDTSLGKSIVGGVKGGAQKVGSALGIGSKAIPASTLATPGTTAASYAYNPSVAALQTGPAAVGPTAGTTTAGTTAAIGSAAGWSAAGAAGGRALANAVGSGSTTEDIGTIGGGALAGAYVGAQVGSVGGPVGAVIGAGVGIAYDFISDEAGTVICTELHRQGYIPKGILDLDSQHRKAYITAEAYAGYLRWAPWVVKKMQRYRWVTEMVKPFGVAWAYEMAHQMRPGIKGHWLGKILLKVGVPICQWLGKEKELCHG